MLFSMKFNDINIGRGDVCMRWPDGNTKKPEVRAEDRVTRAMLLALRRLLQAHTSVEPLQAKEASLLVSEHAGFCSNRCALSRPAA